jgi:NADH:ubiquinone oxidoreductase subunit F (NADH-binding)/NAD-dependent dihydropyrimidine dehydrogenase PreA subunit/(2Fe-2S) ferredoxin
MTAKKQNFKDAEQRGNSTIAPDRVKISVGMATCGIASGAQDVYDALQAEVKAAGIDAVVAKTGCIGFCQHEPLVDVLVPGKPKIVLGSMTPEKAKDLVSDLVSDAAPRKEWAICRISMNGEGVPEDCKEIIDFKEHPFFKNQQRVVLANCGLIAPLSLDEYIAKGGYRALEKALSEMTPDKVIDQVTKAGIRGRGGAGFPTGIKWGLCRKSEGDQKYVICNADEGDPGAFMDRSVMEGNPHAVVEGMLIGAYAIGAQNGIIYCRAEYPLAIDHLNTAIEAAKAEGLLGDKILGTEFCFDLEIFEGAGAFVCGEETALIASIEGDIGNPHPRPPYPAQSGLWGCPTNINNVETWANIPVIVTRGADWFAGIGTEKSKGTKVFSLVGKVRNTGLVEVPMGMSLKEIVHGVGGGAEKGRTFKAVQTGGPSGGCIPEALLDLPVDFDALMEAGAIMGSGGLIVMDDRTCMVDVARYFTDFLVGESCGKCTPCREGLPQMLKILTDICEGNGDENSIATLERIAAGVKSASLCALGGTAPNPVLSTLRHFKNEYEAHIRDKKCPAGVCKKITKFTISSDLCKGCGKCIKECPVDAIDGEKKEAHVLSQDKCTVCGSCFDVCPFNAVVVEMDGVRSNN